jgi:5'-3' exonuclease
MIDLEKIIGKTNYARLKKAKLTNPEVLARISEQELMTVAGIGPKTAKKLFAALGRNRPEEQLNKSYRRLKLRTKFSNIAANIKGTIENPKPFLDKVEEWRKDSTDVQNFVRAVHNIGQPADKKLPQTYYTPVVMNLDPSSLGYQESLRRYYMEFRVEKKENSFYIKYEIINLDNDTKTNFEEPLNTLSFNQKSMEEFMSILEAAHDSFRKKTSDGMISIVLLPEIKDFVEDNLQRKYSQELNNNLMSISASDKEYKSYNMLLKFTERRGFAGMLQRLDAFKTFYDFESQGGKDFKEFQRKKPSLQESGEIKGDFITEAQNTGFGYVKFAGIKFGLIESMPSMYDWQNQGFSELRRQHSWDIGLPEDYEQFKLLKRSAPFDIAKRHIKQDIMAMIGFVLDYRYKVFLYGPKSPVIFISEDYPEIGFVVEG